MSKTPGASLSLNKRAAAPYGSAILLCVAALAIRRALEPVLHDVSPLVTFTFAVFIAARYLGYGPGLLTTALSGLLAAYYFLSPFFSWSIQSRSSAIGLALFLLLGVTINRLMETWRRSKAAAETQAELFDSMVEAMPNGVIVIASNGYITFANTSAARLFGLVPSHMVGRRYDDPGWRLEPLTPEAALEGVMPFQTVMTQKTEVTSLEFAVSGIGGRRIHLVISAAPLLGTHGRPDSVIVTLSQLESQTKAISLLASLLPLASLSSASLSSASLSSASLSLASKVTPVSVTETATPIRVLYLDHTAKLSGGEIALLRLLGSTDRTQIHPIVLLAEEGPLVARLGEENVETYVIPLSGYVRNVRKDSLGFTAIRHALALPAFLTYALQVARFVRKHNIQILHTNSLKADFYGIIAGWLTGIPVIWHVRDNIDPSYLPLPAVYVFRFLAQHLPAYVIANSQSTRDTLSLKGSRPSAVVPSGLDPRQVVIHDGLANQEFMNSGTPGLGKQAGPVRIGIIGRLAPWKGQHIFLEAAEKLSAMGHEARFFLVGAALFGEDEYEAGLRRQAQSGTLADCVVFLGFREDISDVLGQLDILVHASTTPEPFGQVVIEGMAEGIPVVATRGGGVVEIITDGENGLLVPMGDAEALARALDRLLKDPAEAGRIGAAGHLHVRQHFTAIQSARRVEKVYGDVLASQKTRAPGRG